MRSASCLPLKLVLAWRVENYCEGESVLKYVYIVYTLHLVYNYWNICNTQSRSTKTRQSLWHFMIPIQVSHFRQKVWRTPPQCTGVTPVCHVVFLFCHCRKGSHRQLLQHPSISRLEMVSEVWGTVLAPIGFLGRFVPNRFPFLSVESRHTLLVVVKAIIVGGV